MSFCGDKWVGRGRGGRGWAGGGGDWQQTVSWRECLLSYGLWGYGEGGGSWEIWGCNGNNCEL